MNATLPVGVRGLTKEQIEKALKRYDEIVAGRGHKRTPEAKLPRATDLRAYRYCVQDVVMAIWAMTHRKDESDIYVDVFLTSEVYEADTRRGGYYDELTGATAATLTILSEAYRVGIPLQITFSTNVENGWVPLDIVRLATRHGIRLTGAEKGRIDAAEGRELYLALTGFRPTIRQAIDMLAQTGLMSPERAAYIVHHGVWSLPEVEGIILCSTYPDLVLSGDVMPEYRHLYQHVLTQSRLALMGGLLDRALMRRDDDEAKSSPNSKTPGLDVEDDDRDLDIRTFAKIHGREYVLRPPSSAGASDTLPLPKWVLPHGPEPEPRRLKPGQRLSALLRPRTAASLDANLVADLDQAVIRCGLAPKPDVVAVVVPFDFHDLEARRQADLQKEAAARDVVFMICPETTRALDQMAQRKMVASRIKKD